MKLTAAQAVVRALEDDCKKGVEESERGKSQLWNECKPERTAADAANSKTTYVDPQAKQKGQPRSSSMPAIRGFKHGSGSIEEPSYALTPRRNDTARARRRAIKEDDTAVKVTVRSATDGEVVLSACKISRDNMLTQLNRTLALAKGVDGGKNGPEGGLQVIIMHQDKIIMTDHEIPSCPQLELTVLFRTQ